ncbi:class I SAM-dependent methyltransferase [Acetobacter fallax]|uniref:Methyltransferase domain-containing protein n=1 Tax=Acetobacter fallax TaxID=1737473 RepID=A0ABX0KEK2_9PROT|nr:class I SAM-dependent methyltransferase [Acetobacter fallax]NHO33536.1 methyltransferase domain-containing protein [Acetobacter fallax]NHO36505.1 methyltransferase domain-containing protein [Acetobacter fallax]
MYSSQILDCATAQSQDAEPDHGPCRLCGERLKTTVVDLGVSPLANAFISRKSRNRMEAFYPLHAMICDSCHLVQLEEFESPQEIFRDYLYYSSYSTSWLKHAEAYVAQQITRFNLDASSLIVEIASNDGYLLQYAQERGVKVLGIEPASTVAEVAIGKGIRTEIAFFGEETAERLKDCGVQADLMVANNVLAHVPDLHDFLQGFYVLLKKDGVVTFEFPHLMRLLQETQFDTIYHEHFSYLSLRTVSQALQQHGLRVFDVEELPTHGGSLRVYATHDESEKHPTQISVGELLHRELAAGLEDMKTYKDFAERVVQIKENLVEFLINAKRAGQKIVAYGAPAKGNTLLNFCGIGPEFISFTTDMNPHKQQMLLPGSRIPIMPPEEIRHSRPDAVVILPWNLKDEIMPQLAYIREWGGRFVLPIPDLHVL